MGTVPFYNDRNRQLILNACSGMKIKEIAEAAGISRSRVDQILSKAVRVLKSRISLINKVFGVRDNYHLLGVTFSSYGFNNAQHYKVYGWMHELMINCYFDSSQDANMEIVYNYLKAKQEVELAQVTEQWRSVTRDVLWGKSLEDVAKELCVDVIDVAKVIHLTCFKINSEYIPPYWYYEDFSIQYYRHHKRIFFDPIELDTTNLSYAPILNYLEDGEVPQKLTPEYMQMLFERKHSNIGVVFSGERMRYNGKIEFHDSTERHGYSTGELVVNFNNGPKVIREYREDLLYIFVAVSFDDFKYFSDFTNFGWVDLMLNLMTYLSTPQAEEQLKQAA